MAGNAGTHGKREHHDGQHGDDDQDDDQNIHLLLQSRAGRRRQSVSGAVGTAGINDPGPARARLVDGVYLLSFGATLLDLLLAIGATAIVCLQTQLLAGWLAPASGVLALASVAGASTIGYTTSAIQIVGHYYHTSHDHAFLAEHGAEMMLEIARFGASIAHFNPERQRYEIHGVMGPDEFHEKYPDATEGGLRNNAYTKHHGGLAVRHRRKPAGYAAREPSRAEALRGWVSTTNSSPSGRI